MKTDRAALYALATAAGLIGGVGDVFLNKWVKGGGSYAWLAAGFACWNVALSLFLYMLRRAILAHAVVLFLVANAVVALLSSHFYFHEAASKQKWVGMALALIAIIVMELG